MNDLGFGGTQRCAQNYAIALKASGNDVRVLASSELGPRAQILEQNGIATQLIDHRNAVHQVAEFNPDVIHIHREGAHHPRTSALLAEIRRHFPRVGIVETNVFSRVDYQLPANVIDLHLQLSDWCLVKYCLWGRDRRTRRNALVVPYMVNERRFRPCSKHAVVEFRKSLGIPEDAYVFGRIGSPIPAKWSSLIIDCFEQIRDRKAYLVLVGSPKSVTDRVDALCKETRERVKFVPLIQGDDELCAAFSSFDLFLHCAEIGESFGMVLVETLLCQTPVISLGTPLRDNTQEFLISDCGGGAVARSKSEMIALMREAMQHPELWRAKARDGREMVKDFFSESVIVGRLEDAYRKSLQLRDGADLTEQLDSSFRQARCRVEQALRAYPAKVRLLFHLLHTPALYRIYKRIKAIRRGGA